MCACDPMCCCFSVCTCIEISVVLSYYVLRCHYIIPLAVERERSEREGGAGADSTCEVPTRNSGSSRVVVVVVEEEVNGWVNVRECFVKWLVSHLSTTRMRCSCKCIFNQVVLPK